MVCVFMDYFIGICLDPVFLPSLAAFLSKCLLSKCACVNVIYHVGSNSTYCMEYNMT